MDGKPEYPHAPADDLFLLENEAQFRRIRSIRIASFIELLIVFLILGTLLVTHYQQGVEALYNDPRARFGSAATVILRAVTSADVLISTAYLILAIFSLLLNGVTPAVGFLNSLGSFRRIALKGISVDQPGSLPLPSSDEAITKTTTTATIPLSIEKQFDEYLGRSRAAAARAQARPNALLFLGSAVALGGLVFFVLTLPGSRYGLFIPDTQNVTSQDIWSTGIQLLPRLLMLIFIQILAGFFLKQYRSSMEDFRYFESVLRHREAQHLSYALRKQINDKKSLVAFADEILKDPKVGILSKGETTVMLEAQRVADNDVSTFYERLADSISKKFEASKKQGKSNKQPPKGHEQD